MKPVFVRISCFIILVGQYGDICARGEITGYTPTISQFISATPKSVPGDKVQDASSPDDLVKKIMFKGCSQQYTMTCLKLDVVSLVDKLSQTDHYQLLPGVSVIKDNSSDDMGETPRKSQSDLVASLARDYPNDIDARLDAYLARRIGQYLNSHSLTMKLFSSEDDTSEDIEVETGRRKNKGGGGMLLAGLGMMKAALGAMGLGAAGLIAGKALMTGLMALMLSAIIGLKSLSGGGKGHVTYEVISKPIVSHMNTHSHEVQHDHGHGYGHSSYGRSLDLQPGSLNLKDEQENSYLTYEAPGNQETINSSSGDAIPAYAQASPNSAIYGSLRNAKEVASSNPETSYQRVEYDNEATQSSLSGSGYVFSAVTGRTL